MTTISSHDRKSPDEIKAKLKSNIRNLFSCKRVCGACLNNTRNLRLGSAVYGVSCGENVSERSLKDILVSAFGYKIITLLPTCYFCESCTDIILKAYRMLEEIKFNHHILQYYGNKLTEQLNMKLPDDVQSIVFELDYPNNSKLENYAKGEYDSETNNGFDSSISDDEDEKPLNRLKVNSDDYSPKNKNTSLTSSKTKLEVSEIVAKISDQITLKKLQPETPQKEKKKSTKGHAIQRNAKKVLNRNSATRKDVNTESPKKANGKLKKDIKNNKYYKCYLCYTTFTGESELLKHSKKQCVNLNVTQANKLRGNKRNCINGKQIENENDPKKVICDQCGKVVACHYLRKHKRLHENKQKQCTVCAQFINKHSYEKHMFGHSGLPKMRSCPHCDYESKYIEALDAHINKEHLHTRPYECNTCQKSFHSKMLLREHVRIHTRRKTEQCHICGDRFSYKKSLVLHMRIHTGYAPYKCDLCEQSFLSASRRQTHILTKHTGRSFQCDICLKKYFLRSTLRCHQIKVHDSKKAKGKSAV